ncbi:MAG: DUF2303 family protein [Pseudomonadota bacterium]
MNDAPSIKPLIDVEKLADLGKKSTDPQLVMIPTEGLGEGYPPQVPVLWDRNLQKACGLKHEITPYSTRPDLKQGTASLTTRDSFIELTNRHKTEHSAIFCNTDWRKPSFTAVIDYHENASGGPADNLSHRLVYTFPLSDQWNAWVKNDGQPMEQAEFAEWIEDRLPDLVSPEAGERNHWEGKFGTKFATPAELITLSRGLKIHVNSKISNITNLQTGEADMKFEEVHSAGDGNEVRVPGLFMLGIPPFFMGDIPHIPVRLRYRPRGGSITWLYQIYRPDVFVTERVRADMDIVAEQTELPVFEGAPERKPGSPADY